MSIVACNTHSLSFAQMRTELYFLSSQKNRPSLFGMPLIVPCTIHTRKKDLYDAVWIQVSRLASPLPPQEASNHAQDWSVQIVINISSAVCVKYDTSSNIVYHRVCKCYLQSKSISNKIGFYSITL